MSLLEHEVWTSVRGREPHPTETSTGEPTPSIGSQTTLGPQGMAAVFHLLERVYGVDFAAYKPAVVSRRLARRLTLSGARSAADYAVILARDRRELDDLYCDLLVGATRFFRDPAAFRLIEQVVLPTVLQRSSPTEELRLWVPGCSTGEEAYSLAILVREALSRRRERRLVKIFATDVHLGSLKLAARGEYGPESVAGVAPERLARHFDNRGSTWSVGEDVRKLVVFARHDVLDDPPFTRLDLLSCRNLLIYLQQAPQRRALAAFQLALRRNGYLVLGPSENASPLEKQFELVDPRWRVYRKLHDLPPWAAVVPPSLARGATAARGKPYEREFPNASCAEASDIEQLEGSNHALREMLNRLLARNEELEQKNDELGRSNEALTRANATYRLKLIRLGRVPRAAGGRAHGVSPRELLGMGRRRRRSRW